MTIKGFFDQFIKSDSLFKNKKVLQTFYTPEDVPHRHEQIQEMAHILAPSLRMDKPSNLFIYGKTGTGKTLVAKYVTGMMKETADKNNVALRIVYLNCKLKKIADTEYRLIAQLSREFGKVIPATGLPTDEVYNIFFNVIDEKPQLVILMLDEVDQLSKKAGDEILYNLTRINSELRRSQVTIIGISNDLVFVDALDPRVKSSLSEEEIVFPPYNAVQLQDILKQRAKDAFRENAVGQGVVEKCAAYAAREHGDARRALDLLRVASEIAERKGCTNVKIEHLDMAEDKIEHDRMLDLVMNQPKQGQVVLYSMVSLSTKKASLFASEIYACYQLIARKIGLRPLTQRRLSDIIAEFDMLGIINARVISKGRYGRMREVSLTIPPTTFPKIKKLLEQSLDLQ